MYKFETYIEVKVPHKDPPEIENFRRDLTFF
jgi:hypothetical protein